MYENKVSEKTDIKELFWNKGFNPYAQSCQNLQSTSMYTRQEKKRVRKYEQRVRESEYGSFTSLVFSTFGSIAKLPTIYHIQNASIPPLLQAWQP